MPSGLAVFRCSYLDGAMDWQLVGPLTPKYGQDDRRAASGHARSADEFHLRLPEPDGVGRRQRDRPVDAEHRDLEGVARLDTLGEEDAIWHVEALWRGSAGPGGAVSARVGKLNGVLVQAVSAP